MSVSLPSHWTLRVFTTEIRRILAYRVDFWLQFVFSLFAHVAGAWFLWRAVFDAQGVETLQGYSLHALMLYYVMVPLITRMVFGPGLGTIAQEIYDGSLNRYLVYPTGFFTYKYVQFLANALVFMLQLIFACALFVLFTGIPDDITLSARSLLMGTTAVAVAGLLAFTLSSAIEMIAFWADNVWSLLVMVRFCVGLLGGAMIPLAFFPSTVRPLLNVLPFSSLTSFPITCFLGNVSLQHWAAGLLRGAGWSGACTLLCLLVWRRGRYRYTGVGI